MTELHDVATALNRLSLAIESQQETLLQVVAINSELIAALMPEDDDGDGVLDGDEDEL